MISLQALLPLVPMCSGWDYIFKSFQHQAQHLDTNCTHVCGAYPLSSHMHAGGSSVSGREDARLREVITAEVLDSRPSVRWKDIAGLAGAKQVSATPCWQLWEPS